VFDPGQATYHGGVVDYRLDRGTLRLTLTDQAAEALGMPVETVFALDLTPVQVDTLERGLIRVLTSGRADAIPSRCDPDRQRRVHARNPQPSQFAAPDVLAFILAGDAR
jgi:hypothetical protein